ncbi:MAG: hypothetical protein COA33_013600 [Fluviicola sp.]|nr:hypothetical protein [Fluviicola sp.]
MKTTALLNTELLQSIEDVLQGISDQQFTESMEILSGATIGQHIRHVIEFYQAIQVGTASGEVNYDDRKRDLTIEMSTQTAIDKIHESIQFLSTCESDKTLILKACYADHESKSAEMPTSLLRELAYGMDHTIHHLAILKNGFLRQNIKLDKDFGVAPSTIRHRNQACAQ